MGVTIYANKAERYLDMSYFGFMRLRKDLATIVSEDFGNLYSKLYSTSVEDKADELELKVLKSAEDAGVSEDMIDFFFASDTDGAATSKFCKEMLKFIDMAAKDGKVEMKKIYGYAGHKNPAKFSDFYNLLMECSMRRLKLRWR